MVFPSIPEKVREFQENVEPHFTESSKGKTESSERICRAEKPRAGKLTHHFSRRKE
jgi:hypothetical protein